MPRYNIKDRSVNCFELDPCIAAEIRLKRENNWKWVIVGISLVLLLLFVMGLVTVYVGIFSRSSTDFSPTQTTQNVAATKKEDTVVNSAVVPTKPGRSDILKDPVVKPTLAVPPKPVRSDVLRDTVTKSTFVVPTKPGRSDILDHNIEQVDTHGQYFETCDDYLKNGYTITGVYHLKRPEHYSFLAHCVMDSDNSEAWMVLQQRTGGKLAFWNNTFDEYVYGFGDPREDSWLGLRKVRHLIDAGYKMKLRLEIGGDRCSNQDFYYVGTWGFKIESEHSNFTLRVSPILDGNFTDPISNIASSNGLPFNAIRTDEPEDIGCLARFRVGGWWIARDGCPFMALNGEYTCARPNSLYGFSVYRRRPGSPSGFYATFIRPRYARMMLHVCSIGEVGCL